MVVDQHSFIGIPDFFESHFFEFFSHEGNENIMDHDPIHMDGNDIARFHVVTHIAADDFFNDCLSHRLILQSV